MVPRPHALNSFLKARENEAGTKWLACKRSALDHIELTYHDVTVFAIPVFKSLEVLEKKYFCINIIVNQP